MKKVGILFNHRDLLIHQVFSGDIVSKRFNFKIPGTNLPYIPLNLGSEDFPNQHEVIVLEKFIMGSRYSYNHDSSGKIKINDHQEMRVSNPKYKSRRLKTMMSLIPMEYFIDLDPSKMDIGLIITKTKPVSFLGPITRAVVDLCADYQGIVLNWNNALISQILRTETLLFLKFYFAEFISGNMASKHQILTRLRILVSSQKLLPPMVAFTLFNNFIGYLKWILQGKVKSSSGSDSTKIIMNKIIPVLTEAIRHMSNNTAVTVKDFRKLKIETILFCNAMDWINDDREISLEEAIISPEVNANLKPTISRKEELYCTFPRFFNISMLHIAQIEFTTELVKNFPLEASSILKMIQISGKSSNGVSTITSTSIKSKVGLRNWKLLPDFLKITRTKTKMDSPNDKSYAVVDQRISIMVTRAWLHCLHEIIKALDSTFNDFNEILFIINMANSALTRLVGHFDLAGMIFAIYIDLITKFKKIFISNKGYLYIIPVFLQYYNENSNFPQIKSGMIYTWKRFYLVHAESFILQALSALVPHIIREHEKNNIRGLELTSETLFVFACLEKDLDTDELGIHFNTLELNQFNVMTESMDDILNPDLNSTSPHAHSPPLAAFFSPETDESKFSHPSPLSPQSQSQPQPQPHHDSSRYSFTKEPFQMKEILKLFLTIIAYDPGSSRSASFLFVYRLILCVLRNEGNIYPKLLDVARDGMSALVHSFTIYARSWKPSLIDTKPYGNFYNTFLRHPDVYDLHSNNKLFTLNEFNFSISMKELLSLVRIFVKIQHRVLDYSIHENVCLIMKYVIKDMVSKKICISTDWIYDYARDVLLGPYIDYESGERAILLLLKTITPLFRQYYKIGNFIPCLDIMTDIFLHENGYGMHSKQISSKIVEYIAKFGLSVAFKPDLTEDTHLRKSGYQTLFCSALGKLYAIAQIHSKTNCFEHFEILDPMPEAIAYIIIPMIKELATIPINGLKSIQSIKSPDLKQVIEEGKAQSIVLTNIWIRLTAFICRIIKQELLVLINPTQITQNSNDMDGQRLIDLEAEEFDFSRANQGNRKKIIAMPRTSTCLGSIALSMISLNAILSFGSTQLSPTPDLPPLPYGWSISLGLFIRKVIESLDGFYFLDQNIQKKSMVVIENGEGGGRGRGRGSVFGKKWSPHELNPTRNRPRLLSTMSRVIVWDCLKYVTKFKHLIYPFLCGLIQDKLSSNLLSHSYSSTISIAESPSSSEFHPCVFKDGESSVDLLESEKDQLLFSSQDLDIRGKSETKFYSTSSGLNKDDSVSPNLSETNSFFLGSKSARNSLNEEETNNRGNTDIEIGKDIHSHSTSNNKDNSKNNSQSSFPFLSSITTDEHPFLSRLPIHLTEQEIHQECHLFIQEALEKTRENFNRISLPPYTSDDVSRFLDQSLKLYSILFPTLFWIR